MRLSFLSGLGWGGELSHVIVHFALQVLRIMEILSPATSTGEDQNFSSLLSEVRGILSSLFQAIEQQLVRSSSTDEANEKKPEDLVYESNLFPFLSMVEVC